jgi:hypothetical protein
MFKCVLDDYDSTIFSVAAGEFDCIILAITTQRFKIPKIRQVDR